MCKDDIGIFQSGLGFVFAIDSGRALLPKWIGRAVIRTWSSGAWPRQPAEFQWAIGEQMRGHWVSDSPWGGGLAEACPPLLLLPDMSRHVARMSMRSTFHHILHPHHLGAMRSGRGSPYPLVVISAQPRPKTGGRLLMVGRMATFGWWHTDTGAPRFTVSSFCSPYLWGPASISWAMGPERSIDRRPAGGGAGLCVDPQLRRPARRQTNPSPTLHNEYKVIDFCYCFLSDCWISLGWNERSMRMRPPAYPSWMKGISLVPGMPSCSASQKILSISVSARNGVALLRRRLDTIGQWQMMLSGHSSNFPWSQGPCPCPAMSTSVN